VRLLASGLVVLSLQLVWNLYSHTGLFLALGPDYGLYVAQAAVLQEGDPVRIYERVAIDRKYKDLLNEYAHDPSYRPGTLELWGTHVPYPPVFAWVMQAFATLPAVYGLVLWTVANLLILLLLGIRIAHHCPRWDRLAIMLFLFGSYPVIVTLLVGQFQLVLAWALAECFLGLRTGKDWKAGLWLGILLLKPHYGLLLGPLLIWKRRWRAVCGVAIVGTVFVGLSVAAVGLPALMAYPESFTVMAQFRGDDPYVMINWRSLLLEIRPEITNRSGTLLSIMLGMVTVGCTALLWRGPWRPDAPSFTLQFTCTVLATLLVNYHSHPYGAVLLLVPLSLAAAQQQAGKFSQLLALGAFAIPSLVLVTGYGPFVTGTEYYLHLRLASRLLKGLLFLLFVSLLSDWLMRTRAWTKTMQIAVERFLSKDGATLPGQLAALLVSYPRIGRVMKRWR
jgi:hypothetical protein